MRVGSVPYVNARPLVLGLERTGIEVVYQVPSSLPNLLVQDDMSAILVSSFDALSSPDRCFADGCSISTLGPADSVRLFSKVPFGQICTLALDSSSLTSNHLARVILTETYGVQPSVVHAAPNLSEMLHNYDACVLIGDIGMTADGTGLHVLDLGTAWNEMTGLPFVWALWVGDQRLTRQVVERLQTAKEWGHLHFDEVVEDAVKKSGWTRSVAAKYLGSTMNYDFTDRHHQGLLAYRESLIHNGFIGAGTPMPEMVRVPSPIG